MRPLRLLLILALLASRAPLARADDPVADDPVATDDTIAAADPWAAVPDAVSLGTDEDPAPKQHRALALGAVAGIYLGFSTWAWFAWYQDHPPNQGFVFGGDGLFEKTAYAGGSDKLGHAWATMVLARLTSQVLKLGGWNGLHAGLIGTALSSALFTLVEYEDAYYYEFSVGDLAADLLGGAVAAVLESSPRADELFDFRVEYWPSKEYKAIVRGDTGRDLDLKALNFAEDYSGQTYLAALHLKAFHGLQDNKWTAPLEYVDAVIGYRTNKYSPNPLPDDGIPSQQLSIGVSLNLQAVLDRAIGGGGGTGKKIGHAVVHGLTEVLNVPFTSYRPLRATRRCAGDAGCEPD